MLRLRSNRSGFTLLELIIVVIVIGILASIALPRFIRVTERARIGEAKSILGALRSSQIRYLAQWNSYADGTALLDTPPPPARFFTFPDPPGGAPAADPVVAIAQRNATEFPGAPFGANYQITITGNGVLATGDAAVQPLL
jgi:prepilin-type N-terminal cleavage/methylation domain-containing protein